MFDCLLREDSRSVHPSVYLIGLPVLCGQKVRTSEPTCLCYFRGSSPVLCAKQKSTDVFRLSLSHHLAWLRGGGGGGGMVTWVSVALGRAAWLVCAGSVHAPCVCVCGAAGGAQPLSGSCVQCGWPLAHRRVYFVVPSGTAVSDPPLHSGAFGAGRQSMLTARD